MNATTVLSGWEVKGNHWLMGRTSMLTTLTTWNLCPNVGFQSPSLVPGRGINMTCWKKGVCGGVFCCMADSYG